MSSIEQFIARLPKAELHLHLEGSVDPKTLLELARRHDSELADGGLDRMRQLYATPDFSSFLNAFKTVCLLLKTAADYELIAYRTLIRLAQMNVRYAEVILSAGVILWKGENLAECFAGAEAGARRAREESGIRVQWIFDAVRQFGPEAAMRMAQEAARWQDRGVVGIGIGGDEQAAAPELFRDVFSFAKREGLRRTAHAGETAGPDSVWGALRHLGAERIGHGLTAARDPALLSFLAEKQVPVEVCLTSNVRTGCLQDVSEHPLRRYFDEGLLVTLHTDDPEMFGTDLNREYRLAHEVFGFSRDELTRLAESSFRAAFLPQDEKEIYLKELPAAAPPPNQQAQSEPRP